MTWRDRLALWCLRVLTPDGLGANNVPWRVWFGPGQSTREDPKLVMYLETPTGGHRAIAVVINPDTIVDLMAEQVERLRTWASGGSL